MLSVTVFNPIELNYNLFLGETLVAEKATYEIKTVSSFGLDVTYAEHTIEFNKDIAFTVPVVCSNFDCSDQDAIDTTCLCNYASKDPAVCGIIPSDCPNYPCVNAGLCNAYISSF